MIELWGDGASWIRDADAGVHEAGCLKLDAGRARAELNWTPRLRLFEALAWLVAALSLGRWTLRPCRPAVVMMMKMRRSTRYKSTMGVTLMSSYALPSLSAFMDMVVAPVGG